MKKETLFEKQMGEEQVMVHLKRVKILGFSEISIWDNKITNFDINELY